MVHAVRRQVGDRGAVGFLARRVVEMIGPGCIPGLTRGDVAREGAKARGGDVETANQAGDGLIGFAPDGDLGQQGGPDFHVVDDVRECGPQGAMSDVELAIELVVGRVGTQIQQLPRGPGIVAEKAVEKVHRLFARKLVVRLSS